MQRLIEIIDGISEFTGRIVAWAVLLMALVMFAVVVLRYFFSTGSIALQEIVLYLHAMAFMLGLAWTLADDQHVRVDIFYRNWPARRRAWVNLFGVVLLLLPVCITLLVTSIPYVINSWAVSETSREAGGLQHVYLLKTLIPVAIGLLGLQGIALALRSLCQLRSDA